MSGRRWWLTHPYYLATGKWPPPGYGEQGNSSSDASTTQEPEDTELDDRTESQGGSDDAER